MMHCFSGRRATSLGLVLLVSGGGVLIAGEILGTHSLRFIAALGLAVGSVFMGLGVAWQHERGLPPASGRERWLLTFGRTSAISLALFAVASPILAVISPLASANTGEKAANSMLLVGGALIGVLLIVAQCFALACVLGFINTKSSR